MFRTNAARSPNAVRVIRSVLLLLILAPAFDSAPAFAQQVVGTISRTGMKPHAVAVYEAGNTVAIADNTTGNLYVYDGTSFAEIGSCSIGTFVNSMVVDEASGKLYANVTGSTNKVAVVDAATGAFIRWAGAATSNGVRLGYDPGLGGKVYVRYTGGLRVIDVTTDTTTEVSGFDSYVPQDIAVDAVTHEVFTIGKTLDIVDGSTLIHTTTMSGIPGYAVGFNRAENKVYVATGPSATGLPDTGYFIYNRNTDVTTTLSETVNDGWEFTYSPAGNRMYTSSEIDGRVTIFDGSTDGYFNLPMLSATKAPAIRSATGHLYFDSANVIVVMDEATQAIAVIPVTTGGSSTQIFSDIAINQATGRVYVINDGDKSNFVTVVQDTDILTRPLVALASRGFPSQVFLLDPVTRTVVNYWSAPDGLQKNDSAVFSPGGGRLYVPGNSLYHNTLQIYAGLSKSTIASSYVTADRYGISTGGNGPTAAAVTPDGGRIYVTNSTANNVGLIDASTYSVSTTVTVSTTPWGAAMTPDGSKVYVANKGGTTVSVISTASDTVTNTITVGTAPWGVAVNPSGTKAYVVNSGSGTVSVIDVASQTVTATITVGTTPHWLAVTPDGRSVYVGNNAGSSVSVIDTGSDTVVQTVTVAANPEGVAATPDGTEVWVVCSNTSGASSIRVINTSDYSVASVTLPTASKTAVGLAFADGTSRFAGRITKESDGSPLSGALVRALQESVEKATATSNAAGDYSIFNLPPGVYDLEFSASGYHTQTMSSLTVMAGRTDVRHAVATAFIVPTVTWATPDPIVHGTAISEVQLNASADVAGTFTYDPPAGTVLAVGTSTLSVTFTPTDTSTYTPVTTTVSLVVNPAPLVVAEVAPDQTSPVPTGTSITWTATASGGTGPFTYLFLRHSAAAPTWTVVRTWGTSNTYTWTPPAGAAGTYTVEVWVRNAGSTATYDAWRDSAPMTVTGIAPLAVTALTANSGSPVATGTPVTWTATTSGGTEPYTYLFLRHSVAAPTWTVVRTWGASNTYTWTPPADAAGTYTVEVWVRNAGSSATYDAWRDSSAMTVTGLAATGLTANQTSPVATGTSITWTATTSGGTGPLTYLFLRYSAATAWTVVQTWGTSNTYTWTPPAGAIGTYTIEVWVRNAGSSATYDAWRDSAPMTVTGAAQLAVTALTANPVSPVATGTLITWTATTSGGTGPFTYLFQRYSAATATWTVVQTWGGANTYAWAPPAGAAGTYKMEVWVRNAGSSATYDAWLDSAPMTVTGISPVALTAISANQASPVSAASGTPITWTATATGGTPPLQYLFLRRSSATGVWTVVQTWGTSTTYTWTPGSADAGATYTIEVWARTGSTGSWQAWRDSTSMVITP